MLSSRGYQPSSRSSNDKSNNRLDIPKGIPVGSVIGRGGANLKHIGARTGARVNVDTHSSTVTLSGSPQARTEGADILREQWALQLAGSTTEAYQHPTIATILVDLDSVGSFPLRFTPMVPRLGHAKLPKQPLFVLDSVPGADVDSSEDDLTSQLAKMSMSREPKDGAIQIFEEGQVRQLVEKTLRDLKETVDASVLSVKAIFGRAIFYAPKGKTMPGSVADRQALSRLRVGFEADVRQSWNSFLEPKQLLQAAKFLEGNGFQCTSIRSTLSVHIVDRDLNAGVTLRCAPNEDPTDPLLPLAKYEATNVTNDIPHFMENDAKLVVVKCKGRAVNHLFVAVVNKPLSFRFKVSSKQPVSDMHRRLVDLTPSWNSVNRSLAGVADKRYVVEDFRGKQRWQYTGKVGTPNEGIQVKVRLVDDGVTPRFGEVYIVNEAKSVASHQHILDLCFDLSEHLV